MELDSIHSDIQSTDNIMAVKCPPAECPHIYTPLQNITVLLVSK